MVCGTQLGNYVVEIIQMILELVWIYDTITPFSVKICVHLSQRGENDCNYIFLGNFAHFGHENCNYALPSNRSVLSVAALDSSFGVFEVYFKQNNKNIIFTTIFATFYFEIAVKWSKSRIFEKFQLEHT